MDWDWKSLVKTVAPALATALGGPLAGVATRALGEAVLGDGGASEEQIANALINPDPEILLKLKQADKEFQVKMRELDIRLDEIHAADRHSARQRDLESKDSMNAGLALIIVIGFFGTLSAYFTVPVPEDASTAMNIILGALTAGFVKVLDYYFGSSKGSADKNRLLVGRDK